LSAPEQNLNMTTLFEYTPLKKAVPEIRLLWIPPSTAQSNSSLDLSLIHTSLDNVREFVALSYCWGEQHSDRPIAIDGSLIYITESLETALLQLCSREAGFFLWVDAICINQKDSVEKTSQVQIMRNIYRAAVQVWIWLGPSTVEIDNAIRGISELGNILLRAGILDLVAEKRRQMLPWMLQPDDGSKAAATKKEIISIMGKFREALREGKDPFWWLSFELADRQWFYVSSQVQASVNIKLRDTESMVRSGVCQRTHSYHTLRGFRG
jgi:Heterokaryon incompatibility protein (HET)